MQTTKQKINTLKNTELYSKKLDTSIRQAHKPAGKLQLSNDAIIHDTKKAANVKKVIR